MLEKIKQYWQYLLGALAAVMTLAFLFERQKRKEADAVADNKEMLDQLNAGNVEKASNDGQLKSEELNREEIRRETEDAKKDDSSDATDFLRKR